MKESVLVRVARGDSKAVRECIDEFGGLIWAWFLIPIILNHL